MQTVGKKLAESELKKNNMSDIPDQSGLGSSRIARLSLASPPGVLIERKSRYHPIGGVCSHRKKRGRDAATLEAMVTFSLKLAWLVSPQEGSLGGVPHPYQGAN